MRVLPRALWLGGLIVAMIAGPAGAVRLEPFLSGLTSPLYLTHARDGSGRLFVVEQAGIIKVVAPGGTSAPTVFLDIRSRVLAGGEQGLLGLAFHPGYSTNGRFFVNYTRRPDGATVIAEYRCSADPDVASDAEAVVLVIDQPFANHNGGMIEFGPDRLLYIGMGDGGSGNDPGNRAQDPESLLGKILRIDVDKTAPYSVPPDNPFAGSTTGRGEIYAVGLRNPFRFAFDRLSGQLYVGDVGQDAWEEVDIVTRGANMGWRVFEGNHCTNLDPASCASPGFTPPVAEYFHDLGRCSVTGGYVYRGRGGALPAGTYVFGDFCSGEVFTLLGGGPTVLLDTGFNIASFGEDETSELYVVDLNGTVARLVGDVPAMAVAAVLPSSRSVQVGTPATAFATIINAGGVTALGCAPSFTASFAADFVYQTTDAATNGLTGTPNTPVDIEPGGRQTFVFAITPLAPLDPTLVAVAFGCQNSAVAPVVAGVNTLLLSAATAPVPDLVALIAFRPGSDGIVQPSPTGATDFFGVAAVNVGLGGPITVTASTGSIQLPMTLAVCQTDALARCLAPPGASVTLDIGSGSTPSFAVFATATGAIAFDPASNRIIVRFLDAAGTVRGETSAAVRTP
jgi:glucose/arabinose dehydrogenase